ncbi:hypothetical protein GCM10027403_15760 [Arthrobacter tecti]
MEQTTKQTLRTTLTSLQWPLILGLGALALIRPLASITGVSDALGKPATPLLLTLAVSIAWILIVGLSKARNPVLTLVFAGVAYALYSVVISGILSPILTGELQGPLAMPLAILPLLITNALWGLIAGLLALFLQRLRGIRRTPAQTSW